MARYIQCQSIRIPAILVAAATLLCGCLSGEDNGSSFAGIETSDIELSGSVGDGPVTGANMRIVGSGGSILAEFQSDANAGYNIIFSAPAAEFPLTIRSTGGLDLVTNQEPAFEMLGAVLESGSGGIANVSPFSTFSVELAKHLPGGLTSQNLEDAQEIVSSVLNSGLDGLASTGPMWTRIDETNLAEIVKASETLGELVRRVSDLLMSSGLSVDSDSVIQALASDMSDHVIDGLGGDDTGKRIAAVSIIVYAQVLLESMANELRVNGIEATGAMAAAIDQVSSVPPTTTIEELPVTAGMIEKALVGLAAAYAVDEDPEIMQLHTVVSAIQPGQSAALVRVVLPTGYRSVLGDVLAMIVGADDATIDLVNSTARTGSDLGATNLAPSIHGSPAPAVRVGSDYSFTPTAADPESDALTFEIENQPSWTNFDPSTGELSGVPSSSDVALYTGIVISVTDGESVVRLPAFSITVTAGNSPPQISGVAPGNVLVGEAYSFTPTASDPDGDSLTFSISGLPSWATFSASTGQLSGTPASGDIGTYSNIVITVEDGQVGASLAPFSIAVDAVALGFVTLNWVAPDQNEDGSPLVDLAGYKIYWGKISEDYPNSVTIDNVGVSTYVVDNLTPGTYEFVATSFNSVGTESRFSNPVTKVVD